jgi:hypothetical protein
VRFDPNITYRQVREFNEVLHVAQLTEIWLINKYVKQINKFIKYETSLK